MVARLWAGCLLFFPGKQHDKGAGKLQLAAWSLRRSGIQGALSFRGGAGDNIECSPCRYSGRAICRFYVSYGLPLSAFLCKRRAGAGFLLFFLQKA